MPMRIINAWWTEDVNILVIKCNCKSEFPHRADRWKVKCPNCKMLGDLGEIRDRYAEESAWAPLRTTGD
jgi:hypothetical protein